MRGFQGGVSAFLTVVFLVMCCFYLQAAFAENCSHTSVDTETFESWEIIVGNEAVHEAIVWTRISCLDCLYVKEKQVSSVLEFHQFGLEVSFGTCRWCGYQFTSNTTNGNTDVAPAMPTIATPEPMLLAQEYTSGDFKYKLYSNGDAEITKYTGRDSKLTVPETLAGHKVLRIGVSAFSDCSNLTSITIPDSVTSIGVCAFYHCSNLTSISIPDSVTCIDEHAFYYCSNLTSITIPDSAASIGRFAFYSCNNLTSIIIPDSVTSIGEHAFSWCDSLTSITIPDSVTSIGVGAFSYCAKLTIRCTQNSYAWKYAQENNIRVSDSYVTVTVTPHHEDGWICADCKLGNVFGDIFCTNCGKTRLCLECGESMPKDDKYCSNCATEAGKWKCSNCDTVDTSNNNFCENCGTKRHDLSEQ